MKINIIFLNIIFFLCLSTQAWCVYTDAQKPAPVIQYKPKPPAQPITSAEDLRRQLAELDKQIQELAGEREQSRQKLHDTEAKAAAVLEEYHRLLDEQRGYELDMQKNDDSIAELVRKKAEVSKQIKG